MKGKKNVSYERRRKEAGRERKINSITFDFFDVLSAALRNQRGYFFVSEK